MKTDSVSPAGALALALTLTLSLTLALTLTLTLTFASVAPSGVEAEEGIGPREAALPEAGATILEALSWKAGSERASLAALEALVLERSSARDEPEGRARLDSLAIEIARALASPTATAEGRAFALEQLSLVGSEAQVPAIDPWLRIESTSLAARRALERIGGPAAREALRQALKKALGTASESGESAITIGLIDSLGRMRDEEAVRELALLTLVPERDVRDAAATALGRIGGPLAQASLRFSLEKAPEGSRGAALDALLECAEGLHARALEDEAESLLASLAGSENPPAVRAAAVSARIRLEGKDALATLTGALVDPDRIVRSTVLRLAQVHEGESFTELLVDALGKIPEPSRAALVEALGFRGDRLALEAVLRSGSSEDPRLRVAAVRAVGRLGEAASVPWLVARLLAADPSEAEAADESLVQARGAEVLEAVRRERDRAEGALRARLESVCLRMAVDSARPRNLALDAVASSPDGLEKDGASGGDAAANDGNPDTYWDEEDSRERYRLVLEFPEAVEASAVNIQGHAFESHSPRDFDVLLDDRVAAEVRHALYDRATNEILVVFPRSRFRTLSLDITGWYGLSPGVREIGVYDLALPRAAPEKAQAPAATALKLSWREEKDALALLHEGKVVWEFLHGDAHPKPSFHPLALLDGTELTAFRPTDHPWHRGLWFSWTKIDGVEYWEEDPSSGKSPGVTEVLATKLIRAPDFSARIQSTLAYHPEGKPAVLLEKRRVSVSPPDALGRYRIDWRSSFRTAGAPVALAGGNWGGGYAGLSLRASTRGRNWKFTADSDRVVEGSSGLVEGIHGKPARWVDVSWEDRSSGSSGGVAILAHPESFRHPSAWYAWVDSTVPFVYASPACLFSEPAILDAGKELFLRYRILVHPGRRTGAEIEEEWRAFAAEGR